MEKDEVYQTRLYGMLRVIEYTTHNNVLVEFLDTGNRTHAYAANIRDGNVKDRMRPTVQGVGFIGIGAYRSHKDGKDTKAYKAWNNMMIRCYSKKLHDKHPTYHECAVAEEWFNFQLFAKWYYKNVPDMNKTWHLDKDIKVEGNKIYGPDTCLLVTPGENASHSSARKFRIKSPDGYIYDGFNVTRFCKEHGLHQSGLSRVLNGKIKSTKGWTSI